MDLPLAIYLFTCLLIAGIFVADQFKLYKLEKERDALWWALDEVDPDNPALYDNS